MLEPTAAPRLARLGVGAARDAGCSSRAAARRAARLAPVVVAVAGSRSPCSPPGSPTSCCAPPLGHARAPGSPRHRRAARAHAFPTRDRRVDAARHRARRHHARGRVGRARAFWPRLAEGPASRRRADPARAALRGARRSRSILRASSCVARCWRFLVVAFLRLERLRAARPCGRGPWPPAPPCSALIVAPALDGDDAVVDDETWALTTAASQDDDASRWDHDYGGLDWPRDGREMLRVRSRQRAYWKADNSTPSTGAGGSATPQRRARAASSTGRSAQRLRALVDHRSG